MILEGNQRGGAKDLALHLAKDENEHVEVHEIRGFASDSLMGALNEAYAISRATKSTQFLYSLSLSPPPDKAVKISDFEAAIDRAEQKLGLEGQPRVIVFHEKEGRRHAHAVWSRIDAQEMKAIPMPYDHLKLQDVSRALYLEHGWKMPRGFAKASERDPKNFTLAEWQQAKRIGKDPRAIKTAIQDAWAISDTKATFRHALEERGYTLAKGDRQGRIVAVDDHGEVYSIPKQIGLHVKQVRERLGDEQDLQSVDEAKRKIAEGLLPTLEAFKAKLNNQEQQHKDMTQQEHQVLVKRQRTERRASANKLEDRHQREALHRQARYRKGAKGIWDRLNGEHRRTKALNEQEAAQAKKRDRTEKDHMVATQLAQRRMIMDRSKAMTRFYQDQKRDVGKDLARLKEMKQPMAQTRLDALKKSAVAPRQRQPRPRRGGLER